jgi:CDP-diglyceride synthetase
MPNWVKFILDLLNSLVKRLPIAIVATLLVLLIGYLGPFAWILSIIILSSLALFEAVKVIKPSISRSSYIIDQILIIFFILLPVALTRLVQNTEIIDSLALVVLGLGLLCLFICIDLDLSKIRVVKKELRDKNKPKSEVKSSLSEKNYRSSTNEHENNTKKNVADEALEANLKHTSTKNKSLNYLTRNINLYLILFLGLFPSYGVHLLRFEQGSLYLVLAIITNSVNDSLAYFCGKLLGKRKFFPTISPRKTLEGSLGGLLSAAIFFMLACNFLNIDLSLALRNKINLLMVKNSLNLNLSYIYNTIFMLLGLLIAAAGQVGDLLESAFKRSIGIKNSSNLLGSHGGLLDRIDSHYFSIGFAYMIFRYFIEV